MSTVNVTILAVIVGAAITLQSFWIKQALDALTNRIDRFESRNHEDMQAHTQSIIELRERVTRLEA